MTKYLRLCCGSKCAKDYDMLINSEPEKQKKEKASSKEFDTKDVKIYSLRIPTPMFNKFKYKIGRETKLSMRDMILKAVAEHYGKYPWSKPMNS